MPTNSLFSIIIPTHNRAHLLPTAIQSVLTQTCTDWEIWIIDDGSTDTTRAVVQTFDDPRIHYHFQDHEERSVARNQGIEKATGQYFCFLDDDDYLLPNHLSLFQQNIEKESFPIALFRTGMLEEREGQRKPTPNFDPNQHQNPVVFFLENMAGMHTLCFHRQILDTLTFDARWFHFQDTHLFIRVLLAYPFFQIDAHTCVYVRYPGMGSVSVFKRADAEDRTANNVAAIRDLFKQGGERLSGLLSPKMEDFLVCQKYLDHANGALAAGKPQLSWKLFKASWQNNTGRWFYWRYCKLLVKVFGHRFFP